MHTARRIVVTERIDADRPELLRLWPIVSYFDADARFRVRSTRVRSPHDPELQSVEVVGPADLEALDLIFELPADLQWSAEARDSRGLAYRQIVDTPAAYAESASVRVVRVRGFVEWYASHS